jgi:hypothetical protein
MVYSSVSTVWRAPTKEKGAPFGGNADTVGMPRKLAVLLHAPPSLLGQEMPHSVKRILWRASDRYWSGLSSRAEKLDGWLDAELVAERLREDKKAD